MRMAEQLPLPLGLEPRRGGTLVDKCLHALAARPLHTSMIAELVLGIRGGAHAAAAAVFTLLGSDSRFVVDRQGVWSLVTTQAPTPESLMSEDWVVVDVETTGGAPERGHRITEVAAVWISNGAITESYSSLVNPERRILPMVSSLTGITQSMVATAPLFRDVAIPFMDRLRGRVFVAHNAPFDWRFVGQEMDMALGYRLEGRRLCTARLARRLLPQLPSRGLDSLARYFGIEIERRHRALDDALATAKVLTHFFGMLVDRQITEWNGVQTFMRRRGPKPTRKRRAMPRSMDSA